MRFMIILCSQQLESTTRGVWFAAAFVRSTIHNTESSVPHTKHGISARPEELELRNHMCAASAETAG